MSGGRVIVIGVGNPYRSDDGIGPAAIAEIAKHHLPGVSLQIADGEPTQLLDAWAGADLAVVIDAVRCEPSAPGRIHRTTLAGPSPGPAVSGGTHGLGIPDAIRLAEVLDRAPRRLVVLAVEAADTGFGVALSPAVTAALPQLVDAVLRELAAF